MNSFADHQSSPATAANSGRELKSSSIAKVQESSSFAIFRGLWLICAASAWHSPVKNLQPEFWPSEEYSLAVGCFRRLLCPSLLAKDVASLQTGLEAYRCGVSYTRTANRRLRTNVRDLQELELFLEEIWYVSATARIHVHAGTLHHRSIAPFCNQSSNTFLRLFDYGLRISLGISSARVI